MSQRLSSRALLALVAAAAMVSMASLAVRAGASASTSTGPQLTDATVAHAGIPYGGDALGSGRIPVAGTVSAMFYAGRMTAEPWVRFRDTSTGATTDVSLAAGGSGWSATNVALQGDRLWTLSGVGPLTLRQFALTGSPLPTAASLVGSVTVGNGDSRVGALVATSGGGIVAVWNQFGSSTPQGVHVGYRSATGAWSEVSAPLPSMSSVQAAAQHPVDGSIWVFSVADASGVVAALHLTEVSETLRLDWADGAFIEQSTDGDAAPDPENPDVEAVADPATGTIAVAYQSRDRHVFSTSPWVVGSRPVVTRIAASGTRSSITLPVHVERISALGLTVRGTETWLAFRPVDPTDLSADELHVARHSAGIWSASTLLGRLSPQSDVVYAAASAVQFGAQLDDYRLHTFVDAPAGGGTSASTTTSSTTTPTSTTSTTAAPTKKGGGGTGGGKRR